VFANIVNIGQVGDINVLSGESSPTGIVLTPQQTVQLDGDAGTELFWPPELPRDEPRPETFFAVFSDAELDIRSLASGGIAARGASEQAVDRSGTLRHVIDLTASGTSRSARRPATGEPPMRYAVHHFEFLLDPGFQVDESVTRAADRRSGGTPVNIAIRLSECVMRCDRRAMFSTDIRLDAAFITGGGSDNGVMLETRTWTFPRIADGDRLFAGELELYVGQAQDFLEMAIWVSRVNQPNPNLSELLRMSLLNDALATSTGGSFSLVADADRFAMVDGVNAVDNVVEALARVLRQAVNRSIGLYRTTVRLPEGLTPGREPTQRLRKAHDIDFACDIVVRD
jgi:hypothetical protein